MVSSRTHLSIGDVLTLLREEFPDVTISKIRFLESQRLVNPERSPSGYRKFFEHDVERLRWVLRQQRDHFLPLKVIRDRLDESGGAVPVDEVDAAPRPATVTATGRNVMAAVSANGVTEHEAVGARVHEPALVLSQGAGHQRESTGGEGASPPAEPFGQQEPPEPSGRPEPSGQQEPPGHGLTVAGGEDGRPEPAPIGDVARDTLPGIPVPRSAGAEIPPRGAAGPRRESAPSSAPSPAPSSAPATSPSTGAGAGGAAGGGATASATRGRGGSGSRPGSGLEPGSTPKGEGRPVQSPVPGAGPGAADAGGPATGGPDAPRAAGARTAPSPGPARPPGGHGWPAEGGTPADSPEGEPAAPFDLSSGVSGASLTLDELCAATELTASDVASLEAFGLIETLTVAGTTYYDESALAVANLVSGFGRYGIEPRHLRLYRNAVERESGLIEQVVAPLLRQRNPESRQRAVDAATDLGRLGQSLRAALLRRELRRLLG